MGYLYSLIAGSFDLIAGWFALNGSTTKIQPRYIIGLAAGMLIAAAFFHVLPEVDMKNNALYVVLGFMTFYLLEKFMMIHACGEDECHTHRIGPVAVIGMAMDNVVDGAGIVVGYQVNPWLGAAITIAVVLHEIPQGIASALIMREAGWKRSTMLLVLALASLLYPTGALAAGSIPDGFQQKMLAFIAGDFIYIGAGDLLPEAHRTFNWKVVGCVIVGTVVMILLRFLEGGIS